MADAIERFEKAFTPFEDGYAFYRSPTSGGRIVSAQEYTALRARLRRLTSRGPLWMGAAIALAVMFIATMIAMAHTLPDKTGRALLLVVLGLCFGWSFLCLMWCQLAPLWLVWGRPDVVPPRQAVNVRSRFDWAPILFAVIFVGAKSLQLWRSGYHGPGGVAFGLAMALTFAGLVWMAVQKWRRGRPV